MQQPTQHDKAAQPGETAPTGALGLRLRKARQRRRLDQSEVAAALEVSRPTVSEWEHGKKRPGRENVRRLALLYRVSLTWLLEGKGEPIIVESAEEAHAIAGLRNAPAHVRQAVLALLQPYAQDEADQPPPPPAGRMT